MINELEKRIDDAYGTSGKTNGDYSKEKDGTDFKYYSLVCSYLENEDEGKVYKSWVKPSSLAPDSESFISYYSGKKYEYSNYVCGAAGVSNRVLEALITHKAHSNYLDFINKSLIEVETNPEAPGNRYNGERLSIARAVYNIYLRDKVKEDLELEDITPTVGGFKENENQRMYLTSEASKYMIDFKKAVDDQDKDGGPSVVSNGLGYTSSSKDKSECFDKSVYRNMDDDEGEKIWYKGTIEEENALTAESNTSGVNIINPATLKEVEVNSSKNIVAQTLEEGSSFNLQVGAETTATPVLADSDNTYGTKFSFDERKSYIKYYIYEFNFPVKYKNKDYEPNTAIVVEVSGTGNDDAKDERGRITFIPTGTNSRRNADYKTSSVDIRTDKITVTAVTKNIPANNVSEVETLYNKATGTDRYFTISDANICSDGDRNDRTRNDYSDILRNLDTKIRNDANYFSNKVSTSTSNISRVYDFEVTDCTDVNFKNVFRKNENGVNVHTGNIYFGGIRRLNVFTSQYNYDDSNNRLETNYNMTLPLGPYKQDEGYVDAPKMGYRISFDLKTSGYYDYTASEKDKTHTRTIVILPKFYYISKDGTDYKNNVDAYYKDSSGKYKKLTQIAIPTNETALKILYQNYVNENGELSGYKIEFTPNDGYRNVLNIGITNVDDKFSKEKQTLDMSALVLTEKMMCANYDGFIQSWYGEYKLPNSTILVESGKEPNSGNILDKGYLGVVFNIGVVEKPINGEGKTVVITYNTEDKKAANKENTSQWDYEGFLGFSNQGSALNGYLSLQLANGTWNIDNARYQQVKGTVVLFDLDNRAASDFE